MTKATKKSTGWSAVRQQLASWDKPALLALVKDLYEADTGSHDFIQARCQTGESGDEVLEKYRGKIVEQFFPARGSVIAWRGWTVWPAPSAGALRFRRRRRRGIAGGTR